MGVIYVWVDVYVWFCMIYLFFLIFFFHWFIYILWLFYVDCICPNLNEVKLKYLVISKSIGQKHDLMMALDESQGIIVITINPVGTCSLLNSMAYIIYFNKKTKEWWQMTKNVHLLGVLEKKSGDQSHYNIIWKPWMFVQTFGAIHQLDVEIFQ